jgi:hypothetical protein
VYGFLPSPFGWTSRRITNLRTYKNRQHLVSPSCQAHTLCTPGWTTRRTGEEEIRGDTYIVFLGEAKELADLGGALGTETLGVDDVCQAGDVVVALLDDREGEHGEIHRDDAATDRFALALTGAAGSVAGVAIGEEKSDSSGMHDTLLHGETLLVVAAGDLEDVALEFVADGVARNLCTHSVIISCCMFEAEEPFVPLVHKHTQFSLIFNLDQLLAAIGRLWNCQCVFVDLWWKFRDGEAVELTKEMFCEAQMLADIRN